LSAALDAKIAEFEAFSQAAEWQSPQVFRRDAADPQRNVGQFATQDPTNGLCLNRNALQKGRNVRVCASAASISSSIQKSVG
jgi:hypothetical protein